MGEAIDTETGRIWVEQRGQGPDVLLIAGLSDPAEAWQAQLDGLSDRYRLTAFDNRGAGRTPLPTDPLSVGRMADDAAAVLHAAGVPAAHVLGFSGGSVIAQELALRHPGLVRSLLLQSTYARPDPYFRAMTVFWRWLVESAPSERAMLEAFFLWIYTPRAHAERNSGPDDRRGARLPPPAVGVGLPTATWRVPAARRVRPAAADRRPHPRPGRRAGPRDAAALRTRRRRPHPGRRVRGTARRGPQPFQEVPDAFNIRADAFWRGVDAPG